ncbi:MAG: hypothetical protein WCH65_00960 [bacterium]
MIMFQMEQEKIYREDHNDIVEKMKQLKKRLVSQDFIKILEIGEEQAMRFENQTEESRHISNKIREKPFDVRAS